MTTTAKDLKSGVTSAAKEWNNLPPGEKQAVEVTAVVAAATAVTIGTGGLGIVAVPSIVKIGLDSAAISSGIFFVLSITS